MATPVTAQDLVFFEKLLKLYKISQIYSDWYVPGAYEYSGIAEWY
jgi:hypothetical protein